MIVEMHGQVYFFKCKKCGCKFRATSDELYQAKRLGDVRDYCKCPDCGNIVEGYLLNFDNVCEECTNN